MSLIVLNSSTKRSLFLKEYYHGFKKLRILFWLSASVFFIYYAFFIFLQDSNFSILASQIVIIGISLYFLFQPFIWFLFKKSQFGKIERFEVSIDSGNISIIPDDNSGTFNGKLRSFYKISKGKTFLFLNFLRSHQFTYLKIN